MQVVIDIPKIEWEWWQENGEIDACVVRDALRNGITLPKGHGRLIDADALIKSTDKEEVHMYEIALAPTIIEADMRET
jgi:hypothetical protein